MEETLENKINRLKQEKATLLSRLGQSIYHQYRVGNIYSDELEEYGGEILRIDKKIFSLLEENIDEFSHDSRCTCGNKIEPEDNYCQKCGKEVVKEKRAVSICQACDVELVMHAKFCHVCGTRQQKV